MGMMSQMGDMYKLQKEAKKIKKELAATHIFAEVGGVKVTVSGEQIIISVEILDEMILDDPTRLSQAMMDATNKALKKSQQVAAEKMKAIMGGLGGGFPGM